LPNTAASQLAARAPGEDPLLRAYESIVGLRSQGRLDDYADFPARQARGVRGRLRASANCKAGRAAASWACGLR
jgi:hypothetical protein